MPTTPPPPPPHDESAWPERMNQFGESPSAGNVPDGAFDNDYASHGYEAPPQPLPVQPYPPFPPQQMPPMLPPTLPPQQPPQVAIYAGPFVRTYYSKGAYRQDAAQMQSQGFRAINVEQTNMTNGCALTFILIFGLLLTPVLIGIVILCFLPTAFSKKFNVTYIFQPSIAPSPSQPLMLSMPSMPPSSSASTMPPMIPPTMLPPSFQPPQPSQQPSKTMSRTTQNRIAVGLVLASVLCCVGGAALAANIPTSSSSQTNNLIPTDTPYTSPTYPPSTPAPSTPGPTIAPSLVIFAPTVGGTVSDFQQQYGPAADSLGQTYDTTINGQVVEITLAVDDASQSFDGQEHVVELQIQATGGEQWSTTMASTLSKKFLPADAHYQYATTTNGVRDYVYSSKGMKATFTADQFTNNFGNVQVPAGTVNYSCQRVAPATGGYELCDISIGVY